MKNYEVTIGRRVLGRGARLLIAAAFVTLLGASTTRAQSEYSDAWMVDDETVYTDAQSTPQADLAGVGVSEADYNSDVYSTSTYTTLTAPTGVAVSQYSSGYTYARADAFSLKVPLNLEGEQEYQVQSEHTYYTQNTGGCSEPTNQKMEQQPQPDQPCYVAGAPAAAPFRFERASFGLPGAGRAAAPRQFYYYFYTSYSYFPFFLTIKLTGYQYAGEGYAGCNSGNGGSSGYSAFCPLNNICQKAAKCAPGAAPGIQGIGFLIRAIFFSTCTVKYYYVPMRPACS